MENLRVLLCCGAGMSSGFLASNARKAAKKKKIAASVEARSFSEANEYMGSIDVLLLGPHYATELENFQRKGESYGVAVAVIPKDIYGALDGAALLDLAIRTKEEQK